MTITEVKPDYVFGNLAKKIKVICVDFKREQYVDLETQVVSEIQRMLEDTDGCKFYKLEEAQS